MPEARALTFVREKETKNCVRFVEEAEEGQPPVINTLYVQKWAAGDAERVNVTLEFE